MYKRKTKIAFISEFLDSWGLNKNNNSQSDIYYHIEIHIFEITKIII
jgi:hypothetical protein